MNPKEYRQPRCPHGWVDVTQCEPCKTAAERDALQNEIDHLRSALAQQVEPYQDSTPELSVGDSSFESWYSTYPRQGVSKQVARDAYAAGMGDPLVTALAQGCVTVPQTEQGIKEFIGGNFCRVEHRASDTVYTLTTHDLLSAFREWVPYPAQIKQDISPPQAQQPIIQTQIVKDISPMTPEEIRIARRNKYDPEDEPDAWSFEEGVRAAERFHGIGAKK